jgi:hypothetical protein
MIEPQVLTVETTVTETTAPTVPTTPESSPFKLDNRKRRTVSEKIEMFLLIIQLDNFSEAYTVPHATPCVQKLLNLIERARETVFTVNGYRHTDAYRLVIDAFFCRVAHRRIDTRNEVLSFALRTAAGGPPVKYDMRDIISQSELDLWKYEENPDGVLTFSDNLTWRKITILNYFG